MAVFDYAAQKLGQGLTSMPDYLKLEEEFQAKKRAASQQEQTNALAMQKAQKELESGIATNDPSAVREWQFYSQLPGSEQERYLQMKRADQIMNLGGTMAVRNPRGGIQEEYYVTPKITETPEYGAKVVGASQDARNISDLFYKKQEEGEKKEKQANQVLSTLDEAETLLPLATGSALGTIRDIGKAAVGMSDTKTQANEQLKLYSGWLVSNVPRMEGPQSNFDVQNYKQMAADLGNTMKPIGDRLAALKGLRALQEKYSDLNQEYMGENPLEASRQAIQNRNAEGIQNPYQTLPPTQDQVTMEFKLRQKGFTPEQINEYMRAKGYK